ncbi:MAG: RHS repeat domain-containing protein [Candidatus Acidiferrales bacterium]
MTDSNGNHTWGWQKDFPPGGTVSNTTVTRQIKCFVSGYPLFSYATDYKEYAYTDVLGTSHGFPSVAFTVDDDCPTQNYGTMTGYTGDATGYYLDASSLTSPVVTAPDGRIVGNGNGTAIDANGNYITKTIVSSTETDWTDSVGNVALKIVYSSATNPTQILYKFLDGTVAYQTITLNLSPYTIKTNFGCSGVGEYTGTSTVNLPNDLDIPSPGGGTLKYFFTYEPAPSNPNYVTGRVKKVTLPTGGSYEYDYGTTNDGINCSDGTTVNVNRVVSDGTTSATWSYARNVPGLTTTMTTPALADTSAANDTVYTFDAGAEEISRQIYSNSPGTGTPLRTINTTWTANGTPATQVSVLEDGTTKSEIDTGYDSNGNLLSVTEYDWGSGTHGGGLIRTTSLTYLSNSNYTSRNIINLVTRKQITDSLGTIQYRQDIAYDGVALAFCPASAAQHSDTGYPCSTNYRGNPTSVTTYSNPAAGSGPVTKNFTYDWFGNLRTAQLNCCQQKSWAYSSTSQYSQPDSATSGTSPTQLTTSATYDLFTGWMVTTTDENGQVTHYGYDFLRRPTSVLRPDGTTFSTLYDDVNFAATTTAPIDGGTSVKQVTGLDHLGRAIQASTEDGSGTVYSIVSTEYDLAGRAYGTSNPYTGTSTSSWTTTNFDALGRPTLVKAPAPDGSQTTYSYATNTVTVTDPTGKHRKAQVDAAGRLVKVWEPDSNNVLNVLTTYAYTVLDSLATVTSGGQSRTYGYDNLGRTTTVATPETNNTAMQYQYNDYDLVTQRTDARGVITTYNYDTLNRLYQVSYNVGSTGVAVTPTVTLTYGTNSTQNNVGRLITMTDGVGSENYAYDVLGRVTQLQKVISGTNYTTNYTYNQVSQLKQVTYPSGRVVQQSYDAIGRLCAVAQSSTACTTNTNPYATGYNYDNPASQLKGFNYGNGVAATFGYSADRLQMTSLKYSKGATTLFSLNYSYGPLGSNNGKILSITDSADNGRSVTYSYDYLARLQTAQTTGSTGYPQWGLSFAYDPYGNRTSQTVTAGTAPSNSVAVSSTTNRITTSGYAYDANGNMTNDGSNTIAYDAENRAISSSGGLGSGTYTYDGNNLRVKKLAGSTTTVYVFSGSKVIAEYVNGALPASPTREYVYSGSVLLAKIEAGATQFYHSDHLSARLLTDSSGTKIGEQGHYPFGESWYAASTTTKWQFTAYERDAESGNDDAMARYYVNRLGRFSAPDSLGGATADPQSLNRFGYVENDAANVADPQGRCPWHLYIVNNRVVCSEALGLQRGGPGGIGNGSDGATYSGFSFWDLLAAGVFDNGVSFDENGNLSFQPNDAGSPKYSGSEKFAPGLGVLFQFLHDPTPQERDNGILWTSGTLMMVPAFLPSLLEGGIVADPAQHQAQTQSEAQKKAAQALHCKRVQYAYALLGVVAGWAQTAAAGATFTIIGAPAAPVLEAVAALAGGLALGMGLMPCPLE